MSCVTVNWDYAYLAAGFVSSLFGVWSGLRRRRARLGPRDAPRLGVAGGGGRRAAAVLAGDAGHRLRAADVAALPHVLDGRGVRVL